MINLDFLLISMDFIDVPLFTNSGMENIQKFKDKDAIKSYSDLINNSLSVGIQPKGEKHKDYKDLGMFDLGQLYPEDFDK